MAPVCRRGEHVRPGATCARLTAVHLARPGGCRPWCLMSDRTHHVAYVGVVGRLVPCVVACARLVLAAPCLDLKQAKLAELERPVPIGPGAHGGSGVVCLATRAAPTPIVEGAHHEAGVGMTATAVAAFGIAWARNSASPKARRPARVHPRAMRCVHRVWATRGPDGPRAPVRPTRRARWHAYQVRTYSADIDIVRDVASAARPRATPQLRVGPASRRR